LKAYIANALKVASFLGAIELTSLSLLKRRVLEQKEVIASSFPVLEDLPKAAI